MIVFSGRHTHRVITAAVGLCLCVLPKLAKADPVPVATTTIAAPTLGQFWFGASSRDAQGYLVGYATVKVTRKSTHKIKVTNDATARTVTVSWSGKLYDGADGPTLAAPTSQSGVSLAAGDVWNRDLGTLQYDRYEGGTQVPVLGQTYTSIVRAVTTATVTWPGGSASTPANPTTPPGEAIKTYTVHWCPWALGSGTGNGPLP